jgi:hypothetical protein
MQNLALSAALNNPLRCGVLPPPEFLKAIEPLAMELEMQAAHLPRAEMPPATQIPAPA